MSSTTVFSNRFVAVLLVICLTALVEPILAADESQISAGLEGFATDDALAFKRAANRERSRYKDLTNLLIATVESQKEKKLKEAAVGLLGDFRAVAAVLCLMAHLSEIEAMIRFGPNMDPDIGAYPCALALVAIGNAAVPQIVEHLELLRTKPPDVALEAYVLRRILGTNEAIRILQEKSQKVPPQNRVMLDEAVRVLKARALTEKQNP
jgi:hypothetical protein